MSKPKKFIQFKTLAEKTESVYGPEDYATSGAAARLYQLGEYFYANKVLEQNPEANDGYECMDPMEILIMLEEHDEAAS